MLAEQPKPAGVYLSQRATSAALESTTGYPRSLTTGAPGHKTPSCPKKTLTIANLLIARGLPATPKWVLSQPSHCPSPALPSGRSVTDVLAAQSTALTSPASNAAGSIDVGAGAGTGSKAPPFPPPAVSEPAPRRNCCASVAADRPKRVCALARVTAKGERARMVGPNQ